MCFSGLEYYWRLDADSVIRRNISYDLFSFMKTHQYDYGYLVAVKDNPTCIVGLWETAKNFINRNHIKTQFFSSWPEPMVFYNNFEISSFSLWMSRSYSDYIEFIDRTGGIYYRRWGDAPIKTMAVTMFLPPTKVFLFTGIGYKHQSLNIH